MYNFYEKMLPYAEKVKKEIGQPVALTLAHWQLETGKGTSKLANKSNNFGGIKYSKNSSVAILDTENYSKMKYAKYNTIDDFVTDYIRVLNLRYYADLRSAYDTETINDDIEEMHNSPYAEDKHQNDKLRNIIKLNDLQKYDVSRETIEKNYNVSRETIENMDNTEVTKYALLGLAGFTVVKIISDMLKK